MPDTYTYEIVSKSLERYLYQIEQKDARKEEKEKLEEIYRKKHRIELTGRAKLRSILREAKTNSKKLPMINGLSLFISQLNTKDPLDTIKHF